MIDEKVVKLASYASQHYKPIAAHVSLFVHNSFTSAKQLAEHYFKRLKLKKYDLVSELWRVLDPPITLFVTFDPLKALETVDILAQSPLSLHALALLVITQQAANIQEALDRARVLYENAYLNLLCSGGWEICTEISRHIVCAGEAEVTLQPFTSIRLKLDFAPIKQSLRSKVKLPDYELNFTILYHGKDNEV